MKILLLIITLIISPTAVLSQGINNTWLLGNDPGWPNIGRIIFDINSYQLLTEQRDMAFKGTQATISDSQGNFLMSSNGVWIANANNDTMLNGSGLNPGSFTNSWPDGLPLTYGNLMLPYPGDLTKYILLHQTGESTLNGLSTELFYSEIDITLDGGLGAVTSKNNIILSDTLSWGFAACRHANGRDWWVVASKDSTDLFYKFLITPNGISNITVQSLSFNPRPHESISQHTFSQDGSKLITTTYDNPIDRNSSIIISDFDRCSGTFSNTQSLQLTSGSYLWGQAFSSSGEYIYACSSNHIFQINSTSLLIDTVATYDGFISGFPPTCCATTFWNMYLAANGKIYITSGSSVKHLHEINYPDSVGISCDVQQHTISLGNYYHLRAVPNHPNYYLGAADGTICDSLGLNGLSEDSELQQYFKIYPNPSNGSFSISYLLPQNTTRNFEIFDTNGKQVLVENLPPWSNFQSFNISYLASGIYNCIITSGKNRVFKKLVIQDK